MYDPTFNPFLETTRTETPAERRGRNSAEYESWMQTARAGPPDTLPPAPPSVMRLLMRAAEAGARVQADLGLSAPPPPLQGPGAGRFSLPPNIGNGGHRLP
jgi:hypothetical protein